MNDAILSKLSALSPETRERLERELTKGLAHAEARERLYALYPEAGPLRRELYKKHLEFFAAGALHQERALIGGNRSGKTLGCSYEHTCHLTGWYPDWWEGRRFDRPITGWAAGEDVKAVRESLQITFLGPLTALGTGLIPARLIEGKTARGGVAESVDTVSVRHASGGISRLIFKSYDQGRESFQAAKIDVMQYDEEPPLNIYTEGLTRTLSTNPNEKSGILIAGFTPLRGLSAVVLTFLPGGQKLDGAIPPSYAAQLE